MVPLQTARELGIDPERINVNGGAITLCIGGGMGIATISERV